MLACDILHLQSRAAAILGQIRDPPRGVEWSVPFLYVLDAVVELPPGISKRCRSFRKFGIPYFGVLTLRILLFRVVY